MRLSTSANGSLVDFILRAFQEELLHQDRATNPLCRQIDPSIQVKEETIFVRALQRSKRWQKGHRVIIRRNGRMVDRSTVQTQAERRNAEQATAGQIRR